MPYATSHPFLTPAAGHALAGQQAVGLCGFTYLFELMPTCEECDAYVTRDFVRVFGIDGDVHGCPHCSTYREPHADEQQPKRPGPGQPADPAEHLPDRRRGLARPSRAATRDAGQKERDRGRRQDKQESGSHADRREGILPDRREDEQAEPSR